VTLILLLLLVCVGFAYWNVDKCGFSSFDDYKYVVTNFHVISGFTWANVMWAFSTFLASNWHPLTWLSHMLDCQVYGLKPAGHHLTNMLFHLLNTVLLFLALKKMTGSRWKSALVAVLFGIHPLHVESVAWVSERKDVLSTTFLLLTILCYSSYVVNKKRRIYIGALILFAAGLMAKSMIVTLPCVLLLLDAWPLQRASWVKDNLLSTRSDSGNQWPGLIVEKVPFFILSAFSCAVTLAAQGGGGAMVSVQRLPVPIRLENAAISYVSYVGKMLWPANLSFFYPHAAVHPNVVLVLFSCAVILFVTVVAVVMRRKYPYFLVGWLWFLGTLVPVIGLVQVGSQAMADRYTYVPIVGLFVAVVWLLGDLATMHRIVRTAVVTLSICAVIICALQTRVQAGYWENDLSLAEHCLSLTKGSSVAYSTKGVYLLTQHRLAEAHECFFQSLLCDSTRTTTRLNIGWIQLQQGKPEKAIPIFKEILSKEPHHTLASLYCGMAYAKLGDLVTATHYYARAVGIDSSCVPALKSLGLAYGASGDFSRCRTFLLQAIRWSPDDAQTYFFMGICCHSAGNDTESVHWCLKAIARAPDVPESHELLGEVYNSLGRPDLARQQVSIARALMLRSPKEQK
jgi:Flp pilus assembly protein TadD